MTLVRISKRHIINTKEVLYVQVLTNTLHVKFKTRSGEYHVQSVDIPLEEVTPHYKTHWVGE